MDGRCVHEFTCLGKKGKCKQIIWRYLDTTDAVSTSNMRKHAKACFGLEAVRQAAELANADDVRGAFVTKTLGDITVLLGRKKGSTVTYSHRQLTRNETR